MSIIVFASLVSAASAIFNECVVPPLACPNKNITFWLYTRANENDPQELKVSDSNSFASAPWVKNSTVKILIHGYTENRDTSLNKKIRPAYMECCDYNIISVDYSRISRAPCYIQAAQNTELVGMCLAQLIDEMVQKHEFKLLQFHVIGFSLGGQTAGYVGKYLKSGKLDRITALDPALPMFATMDTNTKLNANDAHFVDVLHTNALVKGKLEKCGHADFYANGGVLQPGCESNKTRSICDHLRAPLYYAESITTTTGFYARKCLSWITYTWGLCPVFRQDEEILYGEYVSKNNTGIFFFDTNSEPPYARGRKNKT